MEQPDDIPVTDTRSDSLSRLRLAVGEAAAAAVGLDFAPEGLVVERPRNIAHGDFATNAAMVCAPILRDNPRNVATQIGAIVQERLGELVTATEVAGPGFLNLKLTDSWYVTVLGEILSAQGRFGSDVATTRQRVNIEFVSANPTGPMHLGHGRNAAYGDSLRRVLAYAGHDVSSEFYVNDFGSQIARFGASIAARARREEVPEDGYRGAYIEEIVEAIDAAAGLSAIELADRGVALMIAAIAQTLASMRVQIDTWFSERSLHADDRFECALARLKEDGHAYEHEGALWLRTTTFGDDKDRVLRRSNGEYTYFATDIAYHADKRERGFERLIDVWGADHHGYVARMKAAFEALGGHPGTLEPVIMQLVNLTEAGARVQMSKRTGDFVTVDELIDDIGVDALRFFLVARSHDTTMDLDLALAREQSDKNPVFYVQYAHARIASIRRRAAAPSATAAPAPRHELHQSERSLLRRLAEFPDEIAETAERRSPHRLTIYGRDLAAEFSAFYRDCKVVGEEQSITAFRLAICEATQQVLAKTLDLLGVSAPESM